jgi:integrase
MQAKITKRSVDALPASGLLADTEVRGFVARRLPSGSVTYGYRYRNRAGQRRWLPLGLHGQITPDEARDLAKKRAGEVADDRDPTVERAVKRATTANTLDAVLDSFLARYVQAQGLRSADEIERTFKVYVRDRLGGKSIYDLKRRDIVDLLDDIEDKNGPVMADRTLAYLRKAFNWQATRDDQFSPPIVRGMARTKPKERARSRVLDDQEIRDLWAALDQLRDEAPACFPTFVRSLLLTGQRLREVSRMRAEEIDGNDWLIPRVRYKTKTEHVVPLPQTMTKLLTPRNKSGFIFSSDDGKRSFSGFSKAKAALDSKLAKIRKQNRRPPMQPWVFHDLRRTARSLMSRADVSSDIAERVLGHVIPGVRGVSDRHQYRAEKLNALEKLGGLVERILYPSEKVVRLPKGARLKKIAT